MRPLLVDYAEGALDADVECRVRAHTAGCDKCAAELAALTDVGTLLRELPPVQRSEDFWRGQQQAIMRRVRQADAPATFDRAWWRVPVGSIVWAGGLAVTAALVVTLVAHREVPTQRMAATGIDNLAPEEVATLADLTGAWSADSELIARAGLTAQTLRAEASDISWDEEPLPPEPEFGELNEEELERVEDLNG